ncbi:hypothetical protein F4775DRAFT_562877 [Biscogniauxia sp. FL1348]|nr:hypothetical protein F4775DRAFT_562877 [Biscogniauxia sp. FL1348]
MKLWHSLIVSQLPFLSSSQTDKVAKKKLQPLSMHTSLPNLWIFLLGQMLPCLRRWFCLLVLFLEVNSRIGLTAGSVAGGASDSLE